METTNLNQEPSQENNQNESQDISQETSDNSTEEINQDVNLGESTSENITNEASESATSEDATVETAQDESNNISNDKSQEINQDGTQGDASEISQETSQVDIQETPQPVSEGNGKETVLVTGISGWIAQFCAIDLIKNGYNVRGSLRSMNRKQEVIDAISKEVDPTGSLEFCELDLLKDDGWDDANKGCKYVMHVASPFYIALPKNEDDIIKPAKEGTIRALTAAKKAGVKRVVLTSSIVAMFSHLTKGKFDSSTWTDLDSKQITPYQKSKTIAEQAAWDFVNNQTPENKIELVSVNPGGVMGPTLSDDIYGASLDIMSQLLTGKMPGIPNLCIPMVDVRDVAEHHYKAMILPEANGKRFISALANPTHVMELATTLKENGYKVPTKKVPSFLLKFLALFDREVRGMTPMLDNYVTCDNSETMNILGWEPRSLKQSFLDMAKTVKAVLDSKQS